VLLYPTTSIQLIYRFDQYNVQLFLILFPLLLATATLRVTHSFYRGIDQPSIGILGCCCCQ
jgi:hypothetical protein